MRNYILELSPTQREQIGKWMAIAILMLFLIIKSLTLALMVALGLLIVSNVKESLSRKAALFLIPLVCSAGFGWLAAQGVHFVQDFGATALGKPAPQAIVWHSWYDSPLKPLSNPANKAGRGGVFVGMIVGYCLAITFKKQQNWHGPGVIRGEEVVHGGWADLTHLQDKCDFGPPKDGAGGLPIGILQGQILRLMPNKGKIKIAGHLIINGPPGSGKSYTSIRILMIAAVCDGHSIVVTDPKGELFQDFARWLKQKGYEVIAFNVVDPAHSFWWNMIDECKDFDEIMDLAAWLIDAAGGDHSFFSGGEKNILASVFAYAKWVLPEGQRHVCSALALLTWPQEALDAAYSHAYYNRRSNGLPTEAYETWKGAQGHYTNYIEGVRNKVREITKGNLAALTSKSDFPLNFLGQKKTALFLILPTEGELKSLLVPFYGFMFKRLNQLAEQNHDRLPVGVRFIMDEFANIGRVPDIDKVCAVGRSKGIMVQIAVQNIGQGKNLYGRGWDSIIGNFPVKICLGADDANSANFFAKLAGGAEVKHVAESKDVSMPWMSMKMAKRRQSSKDVVVIKDYEILQLPEDDCIAIIRGKRPVYLKKLPWTDLPQYKEIKIAGTSTPSEWVQTRSLEVEKPPYPVCEEGPLDQERTRSGKKTKPISTAGKNIPEINEYDSDPRIIEEYF